MGTISDIINAVKGLSIREMLFVIVLFILFILYKLILKRVNRI